MDGIYTDDVSWAQESNHLQARVVKKVKPGKSMLAPGAKVATLKMKHSIGKTFQISKRMAGNQTAF